MLDHLAEVERRNLSEVGDPEVQAKSEVALKWLYRMQTAVPEINDLQNPVTLSNYMELINSKPHVCRELPAGTEQRRALRATVPHQGWGQSFA